MMFDSMFNRPLRLLFALVVLFVFLAATLTIVPEDKQALVTRYGEIVRTKNRYQPGQEFGNTGAGVLARMPFVDSVQLIDKRVLGVNMERQQVLSTDQYRLSVDAFARFRITDPARMYTSIRTEDGLKGQLGTILGSSLRNELGKRPFDALLSPERGKVMENITKALDREARKYGASVIDVRIKRADLPEGTPLDSAFERMRTARRQEATAIRAEGDKEAQIIRGNADGEAARIYAESYGKDPEFYDFYRAMQSYRSTFLGPDNKGSTQIILSPENDYLRQFRSGG